MEVFFNNKDAYPVLAVLVIGSCVAVCFISRYWYKLRLAEMEISLKQAMIERGMNAAEIRSVFEAGVSGRVERIEKQTEPRFTKSRA
jgi:hypothetical protein